MNLIINLTLLLVASIILVKSAATLVHALAAIGGYLKLSEFTVAFILMAIVTSLPEVMVGISAALTNQPTLALGNVLGSNLADLTIIIAVPVLMAGSLQVRSILARRDAIHMAILALVPLMMLLDGALNRVEAVVLLVFYGLYLFRLLQQHSKFAGFTNHTTREVALKQGLYFIVGTAFLLASAQLLVHSAQQIAIAVQIPVSLVGIILVAIGTSLPELVFGLKAVKLKHEGEILGNVLGSVVANSTLVLAITALINPIVVEDFSVIMTTAIFLVIVLGLFLAGVHTDKKLSIREALVLLLIYLLFIISEFGVEIIDRLNENL